MTAKPVKIMETVLRDGHQSLLATRMRFQDMESTLEQLDNVGYAAIEAWGGVDIMVRVQGADSRMCISRTVSAITRFLTRAATMPILMHHTTIRPAMSVFYIR